MFSERRIRSGARRGFTLLEMLVAVTLLAVMAVIGWRALDSLTRSRERLTDHDARLDALKVLYGQFQSDCEHLAQPAQLQASPVEIGANQLLLVRDRRDEGLPPSWQVVAYRLDGNTVVRAASRAAYSRNDVQGALMALRQPGSAGLQIRRLLGDADQLSARAWVEPAGWLIDTGRVRTALMQGSAVANAAEAAAAATAAATGASDAQAGIGTISNSVAVRAVELNVFARMGDGDATRQFQKICMTGM
ncbi:type II secretion system protein J (GspJ) [Ralstonia sp. 25mfcol4.1]|uniref:PulJ/GspJ family protein n=1 Tax=Burkholderiaceae TaxID=119060 RepID=UPI0004169171|nr:prepilin-type N-terminal cleavage/methylation domain-containing protein [Ralstonia sp. 25mfcol4.1]SDP66685.1 type II secretion system protein J (GspJ) [Ralstonia sp. 25mfcol4.1]